MRRLRLVGSHVFLVAIASLSMASWHRNSTGNESGSLQRLEMEQSSTGPKVKDVFGRYTFTAAMPVCGSPHCSIGGGNPTACEATTKVITIPCGLTDCNSSSLEDDAHGGCNCLCVQLAPPVCMANGCKQAGYCR